MFELVGMVFAFAFAFAFGVCSERSRIAFMAPSTLPAG